jgi:glycosyltransferase involved in cell wall biosynthesis
MRIGLDGMPLAQLKTGVGTYTLELATALAALAPGDRFELVSPLPYQGSIQAETKPANLDFVYAKPGVLGRHWWTIGLPAYIRRNALELFHGTNYEVPLRASGPSVITIHDLSLLLHSNTHDARAVRRARLRMPLMTRKATLIITPSEQVRAEVCEHLEVHPDKVFAVPLASRSDFVRLSPDETVETRRRLGIADDFLLFAGTIEPRKNLWTLVQALEEIVRSTELRPLLVVAGQMGWKQEQFVSQLRQSPVRDLVHLTGYVADEDLRALYSSCRMFIYPSIYEGFGLPPLEAMACGASVIASRVPSVVGANGVRLIDPHDVGDLARNIVDLLRDDSARQSISEAGITHASKFSWRRTASTTLEIYRKAQSQL